MLKHCHTNNRGSRRSLTPSLVGGKEGVSVVVRAGDSASLNSSGSASFNSSFGSETSSANSLLNQSTISSPPGLVVKTPVAFQSSMTDSRRSSFSSPEPISLASRASSFASLSLEGSSSGVGPKTPIKIFAKCLRPDIEYKTLSIGSQTSSKDVVWMLLSKFKMRHRDPNLFYLTMDIIIKRAGVPQQRTIVLDDDSRPAELKSCQPWGECKFSLQMRKGWLVRVHDSVLMAESQYKCLLISEHTTARDVIKILFHCYSLERLEREERYCIFEQCQAQGYERRLHPTDRPALVQSLWPVATNFSFILRRSEPVNNPFTLKSDGESCDSYSASTPISSPVEASSPASSTKSDRSSPESTSDESMTSLPGSSNNRRCTTPKMLRPAGGLQLTGPISLPLLPPKICPLQLQRINNSGSIHQSGLPAPPSLRPKPTGVITYKNRTSLGSLSSESRSSNASFHEYENYFYI